MIPDYEKILSFVKESTKTFFIAGGTCLVLIFFSDLIGTESIRDAINPFLKVLLIICVLGIIYSWGQTTISIAKNYVDKKQRKKIRFVELIV
ncbi:hypothetical protein ACJJIX_15960 [Microbulbifer sp. VAAC004]|uniref:hypothetical protein n=1 Tax=unclassified Microbulbifer TaxID=2619833 RepID=UPI00403932E0